MAPVVFDDRIEFWAELDDEGHVYMDWNKYERPDAFTYYKIVRSQSNPNPVYPEDGFIYYTEDRDLLTYTDTDVPAGTSYYRICQVSGNKRFCSEEVIKIVNKIALAAGVTALQPVRNPALADLAGNIAPVKEVATAETAGEDANVASNFTNPEAIAEFKKLPLAMQNYIRRKLFAGEEFTKEELQRLPISLREEVISISERARKIQPVDSDGKTAPAAKSASIESFISEYWVQFLALIVSLIGVSLAVTGFTISGAKKKKSVSKFINEIDDTFASFKWKSKRCEAELYRLQDLVEDKLKEGKIDESVYHLLMNRIDKYLAEVKDVDGLPNKKA